MKLRQTLVLGSALVALSVSAGSLPDLFVRPAIDKFVLDGQLEENTYAGYDWSEPFRVLDRESATVNGLYEPVEPEYRALKTVAGAFCDEKNLYIVCMAPVSAKTPLGPEDRLGVAISSDAKTILCVTCDRAGKIEVARIDATSGARTAVADAGVRAGIEAKKNFNLELAIPLSLFGGVPAGKGGTMRCNIFRTGPSCGGRATWAPISAQGDLLDLDGFGTLSFDARKDPTAPRPENVGKKTFLWEGSRWGAGDASAKAPLDEPELKTIRLASPRGERAIAHFRVSNLTDAHLLYTLKTDNFDKNAFARQVRFREMAYLELKGGPFLPDPIFDLPNGSVLRLPPRTTVVVWVDVETASFKSGVHKAKLRLVPGYAKMEAKELALELTVGKADLTEIDIPNWNYAIRWPDDFRGLKDYRFNVICMGPFQYDVRKKDGSADWTKFDEAIETVIATGVPQERVRLLFYHLFPQWCNKKTFATPEFEERIVTSLREAVAYAKTRWGIGYDRLYFSAKDEPNGDPDDPKSSAWNAFYGVRLAKRADPKLKNFTNPWKCEAKYLQRYLETFDALEPYLGRIVEEDKEAPSRYAKGCKEVWSYSILLKQNLPAQYRKASWINLRYGFNGPAVIYDLFDCSGDPFDSYDRNGGPDYNAAFKDGRTKQMSPSRRLEAWYLGHVELKLAFWCSRRLAAMRAAGKTSEADAFQARIDAILTRATQARPDFDALGAELFRISEEIAR